MRLLLFALVLLTSLAACKKEIDLPTMNIIVSIESFQDFISEGVVLVFFHSPTCSKCHAQRPEIELLLEESSLSEVKFGEVNFNTNTDIVDSAGVIGFPTIYIYVNGELEDNLFGLHYSSSYLKQKLLEHL